MACLQTPNRLNHFMHYKFLLVSFMFILPFLQVGCGSGGSKTTTVQETRTTTVGQELLDLEKAYKAGVISERQYNQQKQKILSQSN